MFYLLAGAKIRRVTHEFRRYPRIQLTWCTLKTPSTVFNGSVSTYNKHADSKGDILKHYHDYFVYITAILTKKP